jgi:hypothetical protein
MTSVAVRLARLEASVPPPLPARSLDLSRLSDAQCARLDHLRKRIVAGGSESLTPDEMMDGAELMCILEGDAAP